MIDITPPPIQTGRLEEPDIGTHNNDVNSSHVFAMDVSPRSREKEFQDKLRKRVKRLMNKRENRICLDCSKPKPKWATLISVTPLHEYSHESHAETFFVGGFCCLECSGAHRRLGTHLSFVRSIELDTLKEHEVKTLEYGGNRVVNNIYEGSLLGKNTDTNTFAYTSVDEKGRGVEVEVIRPDAESGQKAREAFIRDKYEKKKYINLKALAKFRQSMIKRGMKSPLAHNSPSVMSHMSGASAAASDAISPTSTNGSGSATSPLQLRIFTSSPRTLALIDKYMNPKPKKSKVLRKMRFPIRRFSRKSHLKGSVRNLRNVELVDSNPNLQIVETRSEDFDQTSSEEMGMEDGYTSETGSVESTKSSMSAVLRRGFIRSKNTNHSQKALGSTKSNRDTPRGFGFSGFGGFGNHTPTFGFPPPTPTPTPPATRTPNSTKGQKKKSFFRRQKLQDCPDEEKEVNETNANGNGKKEMFHPSPLSSAGSIRARLPNLLRTPNRKSKKGPSAGGSGQKRDDVKGSIFFSEEYHALGAGPSTCTPGLSLDIVKEHTTPTHTTPTKKTPTKYLEIVDEDTPTKYRSPLEEKCDVDYHHEEIRAMEAWSIKFDKVFSRLFKK